MKRQQRNIVSCTKLSTELNTNEPVIIEAEVVPKRLGSPRVTRQQKTVQVMKELTDHGYEVLFKHVVYEVETIEAQSVDKVTMHYLCCNNRHGHKVFIELENNSNYVLPELATDIIMVPATEPNNLPISIKEGAIQHVGLEARGVVVECSQDKLCVIIRDPRDLQFKEANYTRYQASATNTSSIMLYPLLLFSEIRANPNLVLANTALVTKRFRQKLYCQLTEELACTKAAIAKLCRTFATYDELKTKYADKLTKVICQLEKWTELYQRQGMCTELDNYNKLQYNLKVRNEHVEQLLCGMATVAQSKACILDCVSKMEAILALCEQHYAAAGSDIS